MLYLFFQNFWKHRYLRSPHPSSCLINGSEWLLSMQREKGQNGWRGTKGLRCFIEWGTKHFLKALMRGVIFSLSLENTNRICRLKMKSPRNVERYFPTHPGSDSVLTKFCVYLAISIRNPRGSSGRGAPSALFFWRTIVICNNKYFLIILISHDSTYSDVDDDLRSRSPKPFRGRSRSLR